MVAVGIRANARRQYGHLCPRHQDPRLQLPGLRHCAAPRQRAGTGPGPALTTGLAAIYTRRETQVTYPEGQAPLSQHDWDYAPRIGLRYDFNPQLQVYGNLSRSVEPPHAWSMIWGSNKYFPAGSGAATGLQREGVNLKNQTAATLKSAGAVKQGSPVGPGAVPFRSAP